MTAADSSARPSQPPPPSNPPPSRSSSSGKLQERIAETRTLLQRLLGEDVFRSDEDSVQGFGHSYVLYVKQSISE